jgi:putative membrane protein
VIPPTPFAVSLLLQDIVQIAPPALVCALYARRVRTLAAGAHAVPGWRQGCFYAAALVLAVTVVGLGRLSRELLFARMIEDLLIGVLAPLPLVLGLTGPLIAPILEVPGLRRLGVLANPPIAFALWAIDLCLWHLPALYQSSLEHPGVHLLQYVLLLLCGINVWMCLFGPLPAPGWFGNAGRLLYIVGVCLVGAALGNLLLWSDAVFYPYYLPGDSLHKLSPLADQNLAGAVLVVATSLLTVGLFHWLFRRTMREAEERRALLDFARAHGLTLSDKRAARAVSTGRGADLRQRLEERIEAGEGLSTPLSAPARRYDTIL